MKFAATINLAGIDDAGLSGKTDLTDWVIIEYIADWYTTPKATKRADKVWINYKHLMAQVPILGIKSKSAVSARLHKLAELGLLVVEQDDDGRLFAGLSTACENVMSYVGSDDVVGEHLPSCTYCGATGVPIEIDHIIPRSRGGSNAPENLTPACGPCNRSKGAQTLAEWKATK